MSQSLNRIAVHPIRVRVNDDLVLEAGTYEGIDGPNGPEVLIRPPQTTLFHQLLAYLKSKPDPKHADRHAGVAAAAVTLRWGSYLAVLLDADKPLWPEASTPGTNPIHDREMALISIEASAALAEWIDLARTDHQLHERSRGERPPARRRQCPCCRGMR